MRQRYALAALAVLAAGLVAIDLDVPIVRPVLVLAALLALPTLVLFRKVGFLGDHAPARLLYAFGTSLLGLMLVGLALNTLLPVVGVDRPLQPLVLAVTMLLVDLGLLAWWQDGSPLAGDPEAVVRRARDARLEPAQALAVCSALLAVVGAVRLNNGAGGGVAMTALVLAAAALLALMVRPEGSRTRDLLCLGLVALSLLLATSLRGWNITGHDIQSEYLTFVLTNDAQRWQMSSWENAYNACLSLNILPTILVQSTGLSGVVVFKVLLQLVFALVPVLTFLLAGRYLPRRLALAAAVITMSLPTFYTDMPYLVRQEIAFFFLALLLLAATAPTRGRSRLLLVGFFSVGVVVSHYSTTYVMLLGLGLGLLALLVWRQVRRTRWLRDRFPDETVRTGRLVLLHPALIAMLAVTSWAWAGPVTDTGGHATEVAREAIAALLGQGEDTPGSSDLGYSLFSGPETSPRERLDLFVGETLEARKAAPKRELLIRQPGKAELRPDIVPASKTPLTGLGSKVESLGLDADTAITAVRAGCAALIQILLVVGLVWMVRRRREAVGPLQDDDDAPAQRGVPDEAVFLTFGAVAALGVIVLIPKLSVDYGVLRALQQTLLVVGPVVAVGMWVVVRRWKARAAALSVVVPLGLLLVFSGAIPSLLGGYSGRLALSNSGLYYERYMASDSDVRAMDWVATAEQGAQPVSQPPPKIIANRNIGVRLLSVNDEAGVADRLYPTLLTKGDYVFVDSRLRETGRAAIFYTGDFITYRYPLDNLDRRLDLVYSSALTRIYR